MGLYSRWIFPCLCDLTLNNEQVAGHRRELLAGAGGRILEIGLGTGLNLANYPQHVREIVSVDPNPGMLRRAKRRIEQSGIHVEQQRQSSEQLPFDAATFDCVVSTFTLCSIEDASRAIDEIYRVLKPSGRFLFLEHGLSPDAKVRRWQRRLNELQRRLAANCRLDRDIRQLVSSAFADVEATEFYLEHTPRTHGYLYQGTAAK